MKKSILFFAALAALFSCSKENPVDNYNPADDTYSVTLTASAPGADTKTTLVDGEGTKFVHWSKGDAIKVLFFPKHTINADFSGSNGIFESQFEEAQSVSANFTCDSWSWGGTVTEQGISKSLNPEGIALYPANATATSSKPKNMYVNANTELYFVLPSTQNAIKDNIESNLNFSYATIKLSEFENTISNGARTDLTFNNACAMIELTMPSILDKKVTSISIASNSGVSLTGKGNVKLTSYNNVVASPFGVDVTDGNGVTLDNPGGFEPGAKYYIVVWPGEHKSGLTIDFTAEDGTKATKTTGAVELTASKVKPYTFSSGFNFEAPEYDYYYSDGTLGNDPSPANKKVVGVVFFWGNPSEKDAMLDSRYSHGLVLGTSEYKRKWHDGSFPFTSDQLKSAGVTNKDGDTYGYTAFYNLYVMNTNLTLYKNRPDNPEGGSVWYVPTNCEWKMIANKCESLNEKLIACGGSELKLGEIYWTPLASSPNYQYYVKLEMSNGVCDAKIYSGYKYYQYEYLVRPIFAF